MPYPNNSGRSIILPILIVALVVLGGGWFMYNMFLQTPWTILVDRKPIVTVESTSTAKKVLESARLDRAGAVKPESVRFTQNVILRRATKSADIVDLPEAVRSLEKVTSVEGELYAINVDGRALVALANREDADDTLTKLKEYYEKGLPTSKVESAFKGSVFVEKRHVDVNTLRDTADEAVKYLTSSSQPPFLYTMKIGDRVSRLATKYHVSITELKRLNPGKDLDRQVEGDQLIIQPARMPITVVSKAVVVKAEDVSGPVGRSRRHGVASAGKRQMEVQVIYENGRQVGEDVISQITTWDRPKYRSRDSYNDERPRRHYRHKHTVHPKNATSKGAQSTGVPSSSPR